MFKTNNRVMQGAWLFLVDSNLRMCVNLVPAFSLHVFIWLTQELHIHPSPYVLP